MSSPALAIPRKVLLCHPNIRNIVGDPFSFRPMSFPEVTESMAFTVYEIGSSDDELDHGKMI